MKKILTKVCIGTVAFTVFLVVGYSNIIGHSNVTNNNVEQSQNQAKKKNMIQRSQTGQFTRGGSVKKGSYNHAQSRYGVIYIGEPTEGLLD